MAEKKEFTRKKHLNKKQLIQLYSTVWIVISVVVFVTLHFFTLKSVWWAELLFSANVAAFVLFGIDKTMSTYENMPRLPELFFYIISALGGSLGIIIGSTVFHHKTKKFSFMGRVILIFLIQIVLVGWGISGLVADWV